MSSNTHHARLRSVFSLKEARLLFNEADPAPKDTPKVEKAEEKNVAKAPDAKEVQKPLNVDKAAEVVSDALKNVADKKEAVKDLTTQEVSKAKEAFPNTSLEVIKFLINAFQAVMGVQLINLNSLGSSADAKNDATQENARQTKNVTGFGIWTPPDIETRFPIKQKPVSEPEPLRHGPQNLFPAKQVERAPEAPPDVLLDFYKGVSISRENGTLMVVFSGESQAMTGTERLPMQQVVSILKKGLEDPNSYNPQRRAQLAMLLSAINFEMRTNPRGGSKQELAKRWADQKVMNAELKPYYKEVNQMLNRAIYLDRRSDAPEWMRDLGRGLSRSEPLFNNGGPIANNYYLTGKSETGVYDITQPTALSNGLKTLWDEVDAVRNDPKQSLRKREAALFIAHAIDSSMHQYIPASERATSEAYLLKYWEKMKAGDKQGDPNDIKQALKDKSRIADFS